MKKLKMNNLVSEKIGERAMHMIKGGEAGGCAVCCSCGCNGPSSNSDNGNANMKQGKYSAGTGYGDCE